MRLVVLVLVGLSGCCLDTIDGRQDTNGGGGSSGTLPGVCNPACGANAFCNTANGTRTCECYTGYEKCADPAGGYVCSNPTLDNDNCGTCGVVCGSGGGCLGGICQCHLTTCLNDAGMSVCIDTSSDPLNCSGCGNVCPPSTGCHLGSCT